MTLVVLPEAALEAALEAAVGAAVGTAVGRLDTVIPAREQIPATALTISTGFKSQYGLAIVW